MDAELLHDMVRHQVWADSLHWKAIRANSAVADDAEIRKRLNHMIQACNRLCAMARGEAPDLSPPKDLESLDEIESAMKAAGETLAAGVAGDLTKPVSLPRGPNGPFEAPAVVLLVQAITHGQHHRAQNASRMRQLGVTPPMTDFIIWHAVGRP